MAFDPDSHDFKHSAVRVGTKLARNREEYDALTKEAKPKTAAEGGTSKASASKASKK